MLLLLIVLGLIAKLALVCEGCDVGSQSINNFDWLEYSSDQPWYYLLHTSNDFENKYDCVYVYYFPPEGNMSLIIVHGYDTSAQRDVTLYGNATNWDRTGYDKEFPIPIIWEGRYYVVATDYYNYQILKHCAAGSDLLYIYVGYRSKYPTEKTVNEVKRTLEKNNYEIQLVEWTVNSCP